MINLIRDFNQKKQQASVLQKFILASKKEEKVIKKNLLDEFSFLDDDYEKEQLLEDIALKPPTLFVRPKLEDFKEMVRNYFEAKKIF